MSLRNQTVVEARAGGLYFSLRIEITQEGQSIELFRLSNEYRTFTTEVLYQSIR